jgi:hypothetical protein
MIKSESEQFDINAISLYVCMYWYSEYQNEYVNWYTPFQLINFKLLRFRKALSSAWFKWISNKAERGRERYQSKNIAYKISWKSKEIVDAEKSDKGHAIRKIYDLEFSWMKLTGMHCQWLQGFKPHEKVWNVAKNEYSWQKRIQIFKHFDFE